MSSENAQYAQISDALKNLEIKFPSRGKSKTTDKTVPAKLSLNEEHSKLAFTKLQQLRERLSNDTDLIKNVTMEDLRRSQHLRTLILDHDLTLFRSDPSPLGSFKRTYDNKRDEEVAAAQAKR